MPREITKTCNKRSSLHAFSLLLLLSPRLVASQMHNNGDGMGNGAGMGGGAGMGNGGGGGGGQQGMMMTDGIEQGNANMMGTGEDRVIIHSLFQNRDKIERKVTVNPDGTGITAHTWSEDAEVAGWIKEHVSAMKGRVEGNQPIRLGDPLFAAIFSRASELVLNVENLTGGVVVQESGTTQCAQELVKAHAEVVSAFIERGQNEAMSRHEVPEVCPIDDYAITTDKSGTVSTQRSGQAALLLVAAVAAVAFRAYF